MSETKMINGGRMLLESLHRLGITDIFGYPGGAIIPIFDEIYSYDKINYYFARHEQGLSHAADGYARVSGKVGVCLATSGTWCNELSNWDNDSTYGFCANDSDNWTS